MNVTVSRSFDTWFLTAVSDIIGFDDRALTRLVTFRDAFFGDVIDPTRANPGVEVLTWLAHYGVMVARDTMFSTVVRTVMVGCHRATVYAMVLVTIVADMPLALLSASYQALLIAICLRVSLSLLQLNAP